MKSSKQKFDRISLGLPFSAALGFISLLNSCSPMGSPKKFDWHKVWAENREKLFLLTEDIRTVGVAKYKVGNNAFVDGFAYPFNEGFYIKGKDEFDTSRLFITYYLDRGVMDHYSAFIYTNDSSEVRKLNEKVRLGTNDYKLENNWYVVNDKRISCLV